MSFPPAPPVPNKVTPPPPEAALPHERAAPLAPDWMRPASTQELRPARASMRPEPSGLRSLLATVGSVGLLVLAKSKSLLALVKLLPAGKVLLTSFSMLAMIAFESQRSGWTFGVGFVLLILIHELGHGYAMKQHGVAAGWPVFIPFFGAMIAMKGTPDDRNVEAHIAYGGPFAGALASLAVAGFALALHSRLLLGLAYAGFFLNLFNMTPMSPLDGGRIAQAFSRRAWILGLAVLGALLWITQTPQLLLIGLLGLSQLFRRDREGVREPLVPRQQRAWALRYFGLCALLATGMYLSGRLLGHA